MQRIHNFYIVMFIDYHVHIYLSSINCPEADKQVANHLSVQVKSALASKAATHLEQD